MDGGWMDCWMDGWMVGWMDGWMDGWMSGWMVGWMSGWMVGCGWMDGQSDGWIRKEKHNYKIDKLNSFFFQLHTIISDFERQKLDNEQKHSQEIQIVLKEANQRMMKLETECWTEKQHLVSYYSTMKYSYILSTLSILYIITSSINSLLIGPRCIPNGAHTSHC